MWRSDHKLVFEPPLNNGYVEQTTEWMAKTTARIQYKQLMFIDENKVFTRSDKNRKHFRNEIAIHSELCYTDAYLSGDA